jgi:hypothetical protein
MSTRMRRVMAKLIESVLLAALSRREFCSEVAEGTGVHSYAIDQMFAAMINRCRDLNLRLGLTEKHARQKVLVLLTVQTMNGIHTGYHRIAL